jgi:hypothetical protein
MAILRVFQTMVDGVAHEVNQRIGEAVDDRLVDFRGLAFGDQFDVLAGFAGQVVHETAEAAEEARHRHHPQNHHRVAQFAGQAFDFLGHRPQAEIGERAGHLA